MYTTDFVHVHVHTCTCTCRRSLRRELKPKYKTKTVEHSVPFLGNVYAEIRRQDVFEAVG